MSTYIVEVDSLFRDVDKYQTQTDFAVTFQTNTSKSIFAQGLPLNFSSSSSSSGTYYNNFFTECSIDPDYKNSNLQVVNGTLLDMQRSGNDFYLSGLAFDTTSFPINGLTGFNITYKGSSLFSFTGMKNVSPYLCKLSLNVDESYTFQWGIYTIGTINTGATQSSTSLGPASSIPQSSKVLSRLSEKGGIFWMYDYNFTNMNVILKSNIGTLSTLYTINSINTNNQIVENIQNIVFAFDSNGYYYFVNNHPWGYHILQSEARLQGINSNERFNFELDSADNLYVCTNLNPSNVNIVGAPSLQAGSTRSSQQTFLTYRSVTGSGTGYTGSTGGFLAEYFLYSVGDFLTPTLDAIGVQVYQSSPTGFYNTVGNSVISFFSEYIVPPTELYTSPNPYFVSVGNRTFFIDCPGESNSLINTNNKYPAYVWEINPINSTVVNFWKTASLFNGGYLQGTVIGTSIYFSLRDNFFTIYMYRFNTATNTLSQLNSLVFATQTKFIATSICVQLDTDNIAIVSPDNDYSLLLGNAIQRSATLWVFKYTISTNTLSLVNSSFKGFPQIVNIFNVPYKNGRKICCIAYDSPCFLDIYDVTDPFNPIRYTIAERTNQITSTFSLLDTNGNSHYYILTGSGGLCTSFNIDDLTNIYRSFSINNNYDLGNRARSISFVQRVFAPTITPYGYVYGLGANNFQIVKMYWVNYNYTYSSTHYNQSISSVNTLNNNNYTRLSKLVINGVTYVFIASPTTLQIVTISNLISTTIVNTFTFSSPFNSVLLPTFTVLYNPMLNVIYVSILSSNEARLYSLDSSFSTLTLISTVLPTTQPFGAATIYYTSYSSSPGYYWATSEILALVRKYSINSNGTVSFITSIQSTLGTLFRFVSYMQIYYNSVLNKYFLLIEGYTTNVAFSGTALRWRGFDVTTLTDLIEYPLVLNQGANKKQNLWESVSSVSSRYISSLNTYGFSGFTSTQNVGVSLINLINTQTMASSTVLGSSKPINVNENLLWTAQWYDVSTSSIIVANNTNGLTGTNDTLCISNVTNPSSVTFIQGMQTINLPGNAQDLISIQDGFRTAIVGLVKPCTTGAGFSSSGPCSLWIYDVSNIQYAVNNQTLNFTKTTYNNLNCIGGSCIINSISTDGISNWISLIGSSINLYTATNIGINGLIKEGTSNLYVAGNWSRNIETYQSYNQTGYNTTISNYSNNRFYLNDNNINTYLGKMSIVTGEWEWLQPIIGNNNTTVNRLRYSDANNSIYYALSFNSQNVFIYSKQNSIYNSTGSYVFNNYGKPIKFFTNPSSISSAVISTSSDGSINYSISLFSTVPNSYVIVSSMFIDDTTSDTRLVLSGSSNATYLIGTDSSNKPIQGLYPQINNLSQSYSIIYHYTLNGSYLQSSYVSAPENTILVNDNIRSYADINQVISFNQVFPPFLPSVLSSYNKDSTLGSSINLIPNTPTAVLNTYQYNSIYLDSNTSFYSKVVLYGFSGPTGSLTDFSNYQLFILGNKDDQLINKDFIIRNSTYDFTTNTLEIILNQQIKVNELIRKFDTINNITGSNQYFSSNLSTSQLYDVGYYTGTNVIGNTITFSNLYNNLPNTVDLSKQYYFSFPKQNTGGTGSYTSVVPITDITYNSNLKVYTMTVSNINDLRVVSPSGPLYGPYININQKNYSAFYTLQWYPGARVFPQTFLIGLYDLIIPNRPIRNSQFPGTRFLTDYPYIYLVIYNANENDDFDSTVINSVYDNNVNLPRFALFQLPTTTFISQSSDSNYVSSSSSATPRIRFTPGFYNLHFKLTDDKGNVIIFDNTPYKPSDSIFGDGVVPEKLLSITARFAIKKP